ncbi:MAG: prepilin peptidase, partial [Planctomycetota bacterium]
MPVIAYVFAFLLGLCVGSFLNVCIYRLPREMSLLRPGSHCPACNEPIAWYDNVPVWSWIRLGGVCRQCGVRISGRYALVELSTGFLFLWVFAAHASAPAGAELARLPTLGAYTALAAALVVASFVDVERMVIPDEVSVSGMYVGPVLCAIWPGVIEQDMLFTRWLLRRTGTAGSEHLGGLVASIVGMVVGAGIVYVAGRFG